VFDYPLQARSMIL